MAACFELGNLGLDLGIVRACRKRQAAQIADRVVGSAPVSALMREDERVVVVDGVDDVAVGKRLEADKLLAAAARLVRR